LSTRTGVPHGFTHSHTHSQESALAEKSAELSRLKTQVGQEKKRASSLEIDADTAAKRAEEARARLEAAEAQVRVRGCLVFMKAS